MNPEFQIIAERAYYIAESQNFAPGRELDFWLQAESELSTPAPAKPIRAPRKTAATAPAEEAAVAPKPRARKTKVAA